MLKTVLASVFASILIASTAFGQTGGAAGISGLVKDPSGSAVPNAKVVISSKTLGESRELATNSAGAFAAPALVPGSGYSITVDAQGFAENIANDIALAVGQNLNLTIYMSVAQASTQINVSEAAEVISDEKTDVSTAVTQAQIDNLPINGRRVDSFVLLTPGVTNDATFGLLSFRGVAGNNSFLVDGNDNTEQFYDENAGRTRIQSQISQDAVQEFQVVSDTYSAEFGRAMGGVVNTVTRAGTNDFHGTGFYYFRSTGFNARDPFSTFNPSERRVQGGATVTGPIIKNKLLFTLNFDLTHRNFPLVDSYVQGGVIDPNSHTFIGCGAPATPAQCNAINNLLPRFFGLINRTGDNDLGFGRLDYHLNDRNSFTAEFNILRWFSPNGIQTGLVSTSGAGINGNGDDSVRVRNGKVGWTFVPNSHMVFNMRFGIDTDKQQDDPDPALLGGGLGLLNVSVGGVQLGPASYVPRVEPNETRYEYSPDLTWVQGNHTLKFGFSAINTEEYVYYIAAQSDPNGAYTYNSISNFALDYAGAGSGVACTPATGITSVAGRCWTSFAQQFGNPVADYHVNELAWFATDQWKVTPRLAVTYGVRWDKSLSVKFPVSNPDWPASSVINTPSTNFAPRIGLVYRVDDKSVIRAGYGMFYARMIGGLVDNLYSVNGVQQQAITLNSSNTAQLAAGPAFPNALGASPAGATLSSLTVEVADSHLKTPYSSQGNVTIEREIGKNNVLTASYMFSRGIHLLSTADLNAPAPSGTYNYTLTDVNLNPVGTWTTPIYTGARPNPRYGSVYDVANGVDSSYHGLAVTFETRMSHGFQQLASYTWSHAIDDGQGGATNAIFYSSLTTLYNGNNAYERGSSLLDQRHRFVHSFIWEPPVHSNNAFMKYVVGNWQFSAITTLSAGHPTGSPTVRIVSAGPTGLLNNSLIGFDTASRVPFLPVNAIYTPAAYRADLRLSKKVPFNVKDKEASLYLNFEVFNVSNSWSPTSIATQEYTATKGVLTPSPTAWGYGTADGGFPDGTQARRLQISARLQF